MIQCCEEHIEDFFTNIYKKKSFEAWIEELIKLKKLRK